MLETAVYTGPSLGLIPAGCLATPEESDAGTVTEATGLTLENPKLNPGKYNPKKRQRAAAAERTAMRGCAFQRAASYWRANT